MENKYNFVYSDIKKDILFNHYRAGEKMPTQQALCQKYQISRMTLIKAIRQLQLDGLVYSKQGAGTFVRAQLNHPGILPLNNPIGTTYSHRDQKITTVVIDFSARLPTKEEQHLLEIKSSQPVYEFHRVRRINGKNYSLEHTIMPTNIIPLNQEIIQNSIYDYLGKHNIFIKDARRVVYVEAADKFLAQHLEIPLKSPLLAIEQIAYNQRGKAFEYSTSYFAQKQSKFVSDIHFQS